VQLPEFPIDNRRQLGLFPVERRFGHSLAEAFRRAEMYAEARVKDMVVARDVPLSVPTQPDASGTLTGQSYSLTGGYSSPPTASVIAPPDFDRDSDVDLNDLAVFHACCSGPATAYTGDYARADFDRDGNVDQADIGVFQRCYSGANKPASSYGAN
jgi:hypothetical protein